MKEKRRFPSGGRLLVAVLWHYIVQSLGATFADFALIRRWRDTFPTRGKASFGCANFATFYSSILLINRHCICQIRTAAVAFPRVGKVARQRRMRAKQASALTQGILPKPPLGGRETASGFFQKKEIPAHLRGYFGGRWWIRTTEVSDNRFTVCPLWPLGKSPMERVHGDVNSLELVIGVEPTTC